MNPIRTSNSRVLSLLSVAAILAAGFALACLLDSTVYQWIDFPRSTRRDWNRLFRVMGYLPTWLLFAAGVLLLMPRRPWDQWHEPRRAAMLIVLTPVIAGLIAELTKLVVRRERPVGEGTYYTFRSWSDQWWISSNIGLPSSHATIAFAGAVTLCVVAPRGWPIWILLAVGCGFTRLTDRSHWFSDIYVGAVIGVLVAIFLTRALSLHKNEYL